MYPRRMRLGLIEAGHRGGHASRLSDRIRGACASASLKLDNQPDVNQAAVEYPRRMRLGLIEARPWMKGSVAHLAAYPRRMRLGLIEALLPA